MFCIPLRLVDSQYSDTDSLKRSQISYQYSMHLKINVSLSHTCIRTFKSPFYVLFGRWWIVPEQAIHWHNKARCTETTLWSMGLCYSLLTWVQYCTSAAYTLNSCHCHTINRTQGSQTCINRIMVYFIKFSVILGYHHSASSTPSFGTSQLSPTQMY